MNEQTAQKQLYMINVYETEKEKDTLIFTFVPKNLQRDPDKIPKHIPQFVVAVRQEARGVSVDWSGTPDDAGAAKEEIEIEINARMKDRSQWMDRVSQLVDEVEQWAKEMNWSTRRMEKKLDDARIGKHRVPALLMQEDICRILLEPVGRSTLGAEGVVDLYLMPAYDDIATLYYYNNRWNLHYMFPGTKSVATMRDADAVPLSKETLGKVLEEMKKNAD